MGNFFERLVEERKKLGLDQEGMAAAGGVGKRTYCYYEAGERHPDSQFLQSISKAGADVMYILTGSHASAGNDGKTYQVNQDVAPYGLKPDESALLAAYRRSTPLMQEAALRMLNADVQPTGKMPEGLQMKKPGESGIPPVMRSGTPADERGGSRKKKGGDG